MDIWCLLSGYILNAVTTHTQITMWVDAYLISLLVVMIYFTMYLCIKISSCIPKYIWCFCHSSVNLEKMSIWFSFILLYYFIFIIFPFIGRQFFFLKFDLTQLTLQSLLFSHYLNMCEILYRLFKLKNIVL